MRLSQLQARKGNAPQDMEPDTGRIVPYVGCDPRLHHMQVYIYRLAFLEVLMVENKKRCCYQCPKRTETCHISCPEYFDECEDTEFKNYIRNISYQDCTFAEQKKQRINLRRKQTKMTGVGKR